MLAEEYMDKRKLGTSQSAPSSSFDVKEVPYHANDRSFLPDVVLYSHNHRTAQTSLGHCPGNSKPLLRVLRILTVLSTYTAPWVHADSAEDTRSGQMA